MIKRTLLLSLLLAASSLQAQDQQAQAQPSAQAQPQAQPVVPKELEPVIGICAACHATNGNAVNDQGVALSLNPAQPKLAGQHAEYLYKQMREFKSVDNKPAARNNGSMNGMITMLPDEQMQAMANYLAAQKLEPASSTDTGSTAEGQMIWRAGIAAKGVPACTACHGPTGKGMPAQYPALAGQFPEYLDAQIKAFRDGVRANDPAKMMRDIALKMTDAEIKAVSGYAANLR
ncbi:MAG: c-type cytochrome [Azoarcus sp.]|jgi:cytochrome c553|nr:c-type cytochrome [Azoarcus sp.]